MKKLSALLLACVLVLSMGACGQTQDLTAPTKENDGEGKIKVGVVFGTEGLGDKNFNDMIYDGLCKARDELGVYFDYVEPASAGEAVTAMYDYAQDGSYDVIMSSQAAAVEEVAAKHPEQNFTIIDAVIDLPNVRSVRKIGAEQCFLAGVASALLTSEENFEGINADKKIGIVVGQDFPIPMQMVAGYVAGARYADPEVEVLISIVGSWSDPGTAKEMSTAMIKQGVDIIQNDAGGCGSGIFAAAEETKTYAVGVGANQNDMSNRIIGTSLFMLYNYVYNECKDLVDGTWKAGVVSPGIADGSLGFVTEGSSVKLPENVLKAVEDAKKWVVDNKIELPSATSDVDAWAAANNLK